MHILTRIVVVIWTAIGFWAFSYWMSDGLSKTFFAIGASYAVGWLFLVIALRRDACEDLLLCLFKTKVVWAAICITLLIFQLAFEISLRAFQFAFIFVAIVAFALWGLSKDDKALAKSIGKLLSIIIVFLFLAVTGEVVMRMPAIRLQTGGNGPGMQEWEQDNYDYIWENNENHFRSLHVDRDKTEGVFRIVVLGDSFTWGDKIGRTEDTWPYQLEKLIRDDGVNVEVVNLAQKGFTTVNEAEMLARFGWDFEPDLVIIQMLINDPLPSGPNFQRESEQWHWRTRQLLPYEFHEYFEKRSYAYSFLNNKVRGMQISLLKPKGYEPLFESSFIGWRKCQMALGEIARTAKDRQIPVVAIQFPGFVPVNERMSEGSYLHLAPHKKLVEAARAVGLPVLDLLPVFCAEGKVGRDWWALPCDGHPNAEAHQLAAVAIAGWISKLGLRPEADE